MSSPADRPTPDLRRAYLALVVMGGIGTHLISEFAAMGAAAGRTTLSPLHYYLGAALMIAVAVLANDIRALIARASSSRDAKRLADIGLRTLPLGGKRGFIATTACLQFAVGWTTILAEGSPLLGHDVAAGAIGALFSAFVLALAIRAISRRLPSFACAAIEFHPVSAEAPQIRARIVAPCRSAFAQDIWSSRLYNRPPPLLQSA